jgi:NADPH:quinone reductase
MRVVEISHHGPPDVLRIERRPKPHAGPGEVLVAVNAAGVCRADALQRAGAYPPPPGASDIPGLEVAGVIEAIGPGVTDFNVGDQVCALLTGGGYSEFVAVPAGQALPVPPNWNIVEAATLPENMFTVYDNLVTRAHFHSGQTILVHGGTSGIGTTAIMLARALGARFIAATAGSDEKCRACRDLGANLAINYRTGDFVAQVLAATNDRGVDVILDIVGGDYIPRDLNAIAPDGRVVCIATAGGSRTEIDLAVMLRKRATLMASSLRARTIEQKALIAQDLRAHVWPLLSARNPIRPVIDSVFALDHAADAHRRLESPEHIGKIILSIP